MQSHLIKLYLASADCADEYSAQILSLPDQNRLQMAPHLAQQQNWRCSRFLKHQAIRQGDVICSLSHSRGHALLASSMIDVGVDLEYMCPQRAVHTWHEWVLTPCEQQWLHARGNCLQDYYAIWCVKEALIKANGLAWADLPYCGLMWEENGSCHLQANGTYWHGQTWIMDTFMLACVWRFGVSVQHLWQGFGRWQQIKPQIYYTF